VDNLFDLIVNLRRDGLAILLVEQNTQMALDVASRGFVMELGRVTMQGPVNELRHNEQLARAYLGRT
jgi:branched-chain amino acid transport system ATP-binding protein